ncbi:39S ribosomal protein L37, mitochondrial [Homalodisca vitripennis]|nr:39S ribosomal protein L37, mitochondrial [Homalodisca vitripennis]
MKFTIPLGKHNLYRMMRNQWKVARKRPVLKTNAEKVLQANNLELVDANEFVASPKKTFDFSSIVGLAPRPVPKDENHPLYKEQPCFFYRDHSVLLEGLPQALALTNTVQLEADILPPRIQKLVDQVQLPNQDKLVQSNQSGKMAAGGRKDDVCGVCVNKVTKRTGGVKCNGFCNKWYHIKCTTLSSEDFKKFLDLSGKVMWYCEPCKVKVNELVLSGDSSTENVQAESENGCLNPHLKLILDQLDIVSENYSKLEERMTLVEKVSNRNVNLSTQGSICDEAGECTDMSGSEGISNAVALDNNVGVDIESNDNSDNSLSDKADVTSEAAGSRRPSGGAIRVVNGQRVINNSEWKLGICLVTTSMKCVNLDLMEVMLNKVSLGLGTTQLMCL